jgi:hypothetical protein
VQSLALADLERGAAEAAAGGSSGSGNGGSGSGGGLWGFLQWLSGGGRPAPAAAPGAPAPPPAASPASATSFLLLACDGVWDVLSNEEACEFIARDVVAAAGAAGAARAAAAAAQGSSDNGSGSGSGSGSDATAAEEAACAAAALYLGGTAERLRTLVLERTAKAEGVTVRQLQSLKPGKGGRRNVHDDITAVVLFVGGLPGVARFASGVAGGAGAGAGAGQVLA